MTIKIKNKEENIVTSNIFGYELNEHNELINNIYLSSYLSPLYIV